MDEINRGNIPKIFGELLFLLEYRDEAVELQYGQGAFSLPANLFVIGTMNTADRSIALVDAALRRRFFFVPFFPTEEPVAGVLRGWLEEDGRDELPALLLDELNRRIAKDEVAIGPSYLMTGDGSRASSASGATRSCRSSTSTTTGRRSMSTQSSASKPALSAVKGAESRAVDEESDRGRAIAGHRRSERARLIDVEAWVERRLELSLDEIAEIERSGLRRSSTGRRRALRVKTSSRVGLWSATAGSFAWCPRLADTAAHVPPRLRADETGGRTRRRFEQHDDLFSAIANAFSWHATWALDRGLIRGYLRRDERRDRLRGRVRFGDQIARSRRPSAPARDLVRRLHRGRAREPDAPNRRVAPSPPASRPTQRAAACSGCARFWPRCRASVRVAAEGAGDHAAQRALRARARARRARAGGRVDRSSRDGTKATTFVFDMNKVFEDFVTAALGEAMRRHGGELRSQVTEQKLSQHIALKPDLAWSERRVGGGARREVQAALQRVVPQRRCVPDARLHARVRARQGMAHLRARAGAARASSTRSRPRARRWW